jgi:hypothetical protein
MLFNLSIANFENPAASLSTAYEVIKDAGKVETLIVLGIYLGVEIEVTCQFEGSLYFLNFR